MAKSSFRTTTWDPLLIIAQVNKASKQITLDAILSDEEIRMDAVSGWTLALVWFLHAFLAIPLLVLIIQRAKLILDFVLTMHGIHLVAVWIYRKQIPTGGVWWALQVIHALIMTLGGEWACMRREMEPIMMTAKPKKPQTSSSSTAAAAPSAAASSSSNIPQNTNDDDSNDSEDNEDGQEEGSEWIHVISKQNKRKVSDAHNLLEPAEEGSLTTVMDKAKKAILQGTSRVTKKKSKSRRYEVIPMKDVDEPGPSK
ncbi:integral membrane protein S linking to the trans Golgi network-domain-containing protein [Phycomyces nitens]|nr:integral membrane protein S linking to the trans Golgi network-domain-containing protein [Phycomyces nitens]